MQACFVQIAMNMDICTGVGTLFQRDSHSVRMTQAGFSLHPGRISV